MSDKPTIIIKSPGIWVPLFVVFLVLKLTNTIDWSWWWVTSPIWIPFVIMAVMFGMVFAFAVVAAYLKSR